MTPINLLDNLVEILKEILVLQSTANETGFNVYSQTLPRKQSAKDDSMFPYCIVSLGDGRQSDNSTQDVIITFGIKDKNNDYQGFRDIANAIEGVRQKFSKNPNINDIFDISSSIDWTISDGLETYPFYYGAIILTVTIPQTTNYSEII